MEKYPQKHKRAKRYDTSGVAHELTFSTYKQFPILTPYPIHAQLLADAIGNAIERHNYALLAFVIMPDHVHLLVIPRDPDYSISTLLKAIKRPHSFRVKQHMLANDSPWLGRLTIRERRDKTTFRFWQEGGGYDREVDDTQYLYPMIDYIHTNPVRRGLVETPSDWKWSSWHHYETGNLDGLPSVSGIDLI